MNDREEKPRPPELGFLSILVHSLLCALGISTVLLAPLPMIAAGVRLSEPWPKIVAIIGAVLALLLLDAPPAAVVLAFIYSIFIADSVIREVDFWKLARQAASLSLLGAVCLLLVRSGWSGTSLPSQWVEIVDNSISQVKAALVTEPSFAWDELRTLLLFEGPFLYLSGALLSLWLSLGIAAHLGWLEKNRVYCAKALRSLRLPWWLSVAFVILFVFGLAVPSTGHHLLIGLKCLGATMMFMQGCVCLSELMERRMVRSRVRTLVFSSAVLVGFYALVGIGVMGPWIFRKSNGLKSLEEAV